MSSWLIWFIVAAFFTAAEVVSLTLFLAPFAAGAFLAGLADLLGLGDLFVWPIFFLSSAVFLLVVRPVARGHRRRRPELRTGSDALIGVGGKVLERVANNEGSGLVRINDETWTARAFDEDKTFAIGTRIQVVEIRGATAFVDEL